MKQGHTLINLFDLNYFLSDPISNIAILLLGSLMYEVWLSIELVMLSKHYIFCPFSFCLQSFLASGSFPVSHLFASGGQSIGASTSASIIPMEYSGLISFRIDWFDLAVQETLKSLLQQPQFESISSSLLSLLYGPTLTSVHNYWKNHSFDYTDLCCQSDVSAF